MTHHASQVQLREVRESDLPILFEHQYDPIANEMAAFPARERDVFMAHWAKILVNPDLIARTIVWTGKSGNDREKETPLNPPFVRGEATQPNPRERVAGVISCFERDGKRLVGYWIGREFWGKGIATKALAELLKEVRFRPLYAFVIKENPASIRVLEKCGFSLCGEEKSAAATGGDERDEYLMILSAEA